MINDYTIIREVGKGGMGCVYEATDSFGRKVALKMMSCTAAMQSDYRDMFNQEVKSLQILSNPSIVKIVGESFSDDSGNLYLPMEFVEGKTLSQIIQKNGPFSEEKALSIFISLLDTFAYIHKKHCIHRDVKPSNVMIRLDDSVCVIDFGIAKDSKTVTGQTVGRIVGTDGYMSPEQADGFNIDTRTDIYSLGCLLHYMLTGSHAIVKQSNEYDTICAILENDFPLVSEKGFSVSDRTQKAILTAVNKNMTLRFQTAEEFKEALTGQSINRYKVTVGRSNCNIVLLGEYVSSHHLDIIWQLKDSRGTSFSVTIEDHSTNGTGINGRKIKNDSFSFDVDKSVVALMNDCSSLPVVMIAGLPDYTLDWKTVLNFLFEKMDLPTSIVRDTEVGGGDNNTGVDYSNAINVEKISIGFGLLCFLIPIVGWVLGSVWNLSSPSKAKDANVLGWFGFFLYFILIIILLFSNF